MKAQLGFVDLVPVEFSSFEIKAENIPELSLGNALRFGTVGP